MIVSIHLDELRLSTTIADVVPEPHIAGLLVFGLGWLAIFPRNGRSRRGGRPRGKD